MTQLEFDNYKVQIQYIISQKAGNYVNYLAIDKHALCNDIANLELLVAYMDIINSYSLEEESVLDENTSNYFTRGEMQDVVTHINKICNTQYNIDFIKE